MRRRAARFWRLFKWVLIGLAALFVFLFLLASLVVVFPGSFLGELVRSAVFGWGLFMARVLPEVEVSWPMVASGLAAAGVASWILHVLALRFAGGNGWTGRQTAAVMMLLLSLFGASICGAGIVHQIGWLAGGDVIVRDPIASDQREHHRLYQLYVGLLLYAGEHGGRYPERLEQLAQEGFIDRFHTVVMTTDSIGQAIEPVAFFGAGLTRDAPGSSILIATARPVFPGARRVVATNDGGVRTMREDEFQERLAAQLDELARRGRR